jgi:hypothetical protein
VLLGQGYCTPHGAVIDEYGTMVEWWLTNENQRTEENNMYISLSIRYNLYFAHISDEVMSQNLSTCSITTQDVLALLPSSGVAPNKIIHAGTVKFTLGFAVYIVPRNIKTFSIFCRV